MAYFFDLKSIREQLPLYMRDWLIDSYSYIWYLNEEDEYIPDDAVLILSSMPDSEVAVYQCLESNAIYKTPIKSLDIVLNASELTDNQNAVYYDTHNAVIHLGDGTDGYKPAFQQPLIVVYKPKEYGVRTPYLVNLSENETFHFYDYNVPDNTNSIFVKCGSKTDGYYNYFAVETFSTELRNVGLTTAIYPNMSSYMFARYNIQPEKLYAFIYITYINGVNTPIARSLEITPSPYPCGDKGEMKVYEWELYYSLSNSNLIPASSSIYPFGNSTGLILGDTMTVDAQVYASYEDTGNSSFMDTYLYTTKDFKTSYLAYNPTYLIMQSAGSVNTGTKREGFTSPVSVSIPFDRVIIRCVNNDTAKKVTAVKVYMRKK